MLELISGKLRAFARECNGSILVLLAIVLPVGAVGALGTLDYITLTRQKVSLQSATDAAAIAAAREMRLLLQMQNIDMNAEMYRVARGMLDSNLPDYDWPVDLNVQHFDETKVRVDARSDVPLMLGTLVQSETVQVDAYAVAQIMGGQDVCAVALGEEDAYTLDLNNDSVITGPGCSIYSNAAHNNGLAVSENAKIDAAQICSAGGARGASSAFSPPAHTDCKPLKDPLAHKIDQIANVAGGPCVDTGPTIFDGSTTETLSPGRYCHAVRVSGDVHMVMQPGIFAFDDTTLTLDGHSFVKGEDVGLVFTGDNSRMIIGGEADVRLSGRVSGEMAGILMIAEPRDDESMREFTITSPNVRELVGTVYLPGDYLNILTNSPVAADSAFTVVMAKRMKLHGSASLVLNRDYAATTVPKSGDLSDYGGGLALVE